MARIDGFFRSRRYGDYARLERHPLDEVSKVELAMLPVFLLMLVLFVTIVISELADHLVHLEVLFVGLILSILWKEIVWPNYTHWDFEGSVYITEDCLLFVHDDGRLWKRLNLSCAITLELHRSWLKWDRTLGRADGFHFHDGITDETYRIDPSYYSERMLRDPRMWNLVLRGVERNEVLASERTMALLEKVGHGEAR